MDQRRRDYHRDGADSRASRDYYERDRRDYPKGPDRRDERRSRDYDDRDRHRYPDRSGYRRIDGRERGHGSRPYDRRPDRQPHPREDIRDRQRGRSPNGRDSDYRDRRREYEPRYRDYGAPRSRDSDHPEEDRRHGAIKTDEKLGKSNPSSVTSSYTDNTANAVGDANSGVMDNGMDDESSMAAMMGFSDFGTTAGKKHAEVGAVEKKKQSKYRQYMNRPGGFNKLLESNTMKHKQNGP